MNILIVGRGSIALQHKKNIESYGHEATLFISIFDYTFENDQSIISSFKNSKTWFFLNLGTMKSSLSFKYLTNQS